MASPPSPIAADTPSSPTSTKPFRFKRKRSPTFTDREPSKRHSLSPSTSDRPRRHRHRHHHRLHRTRRRPRTPPTPENSAWDTSLDPDAAFRESLFDALADDEGAAYWEGVYGQPIHNYSPYYQCAGSANDDPEDPDNPRLERMSDEEYVSYVRARMWEKSHGHVVEERRKREEERAKRKERERVGREWERGVEEALRRGEERRRRGRWKGVWGRYLEGWGGAQGKGKGEGICWPVESGKRKDVERGEIERFYRHAPQAAQDGQGQVDLGEVLKKERVRWHPDKMQQRAGSEGLDVETMKLVTAVFQVVDRLWSDSKAK